MTYQSAVALAIIVGRFDTAAPVSAEDTHTLMTKARAIDLDFADKLWHSLLLKRDGFRLATYDVDRFYRELALYA